MAKRLMAIPLALAVVLGAQTVVFAQAEPSTETTAQTETRTRGDVAIRATTETRIADLPAGHWATSSTQLAVANNILALENGQFMGERQLTHAELRTAMESLVSTAENIAGKGALTELRASIGVIPSDNMPVKRLELAQTLARFLDSAATNQLVALGSQRSDAVRFKDMGASVPQAVRSVVDKYTVMTGFPDNTFRPSLTVTRYQLAAISKEILDDMREAPIAQQPAAPIAVEPQAPTVVVVPPMEQEEEIVAAPVDMGRPSFRQNAPIVLSWQALNSNNLTGQASPFNVIPVQGMITGYQGPVMLQNVTNFRYDLYSSNVLDSEFRIGYGDLKYGMLQFVPYVGANVGLGTSIPSGSTQYDTYVGATYGGIVSVMPMHNLELWGNVGQSALLAAGRWNQNFTPISYPGALGAFLSNYGVGADFYVAPNIALTLGANTWQTPASLYTADTLTANGVFNTYGGNIGLGFSF